ncbi:acetoacetate metabolism regulatory protein AtoC [Geobacter sp. OR-1]|uniref:sigma-54-dependent transcriptional regulator n=1 Tax=Geobacter sp. OR-1 TaxID=1266765 RepID=UPI000542F39D|nr:sigma-54 dependent transcriptional regulator [Geobacter sp. OR-1]GAM07855.1 acetoacetate metabolism regulatory protein AtoC [Geobacter sp. OR-1]
MKTPESKRILVVDDEENLRHMLKVMLQKIGYAVELATDGADALDKLSHDRFDFVLCDIRMPGIDGTEFIRLAVESGVTATIIMMSAYGTVDSAIDCMKRGAYDYISKPFKSDEIALVLKKAEERERLKLENRQLQEVVNREFCFSGIISKNQQMLEIFSLVKKVCDFKTTVLVLGESGTGKELIAKALHFNSVRRKGPFIAVNCGAIPENLLESELFGHVKGAFTDASCDKPGLFERADGGTLFLDEIGEMPLSLQVKLLRVLQEEEIRRVGASSAKKVDVRVVSATSRDLEADVIKGRFREDLYFRLNVFSLTLSPLRERTEDIPLLVDHFLNRYGDKFGKSGIRCSQSTMQLLLDYQWPGNVRELENTIERAVVVCDGSTLGPECLPEKLRRTSGGKLPEIIPPDCISLKRAEELLERAFIRKALAATGGNRSQAARILEISHRSLLYKLKEYKID